MKKGRSLELVVKTLEKHLAGDSEAIIESPKKLEDRINGRMREHDVVITFQQAHHELLIAIECKDLSRPVGVPAVEAFRTKCENTGINQGVLVSSSGFAKSAMKSASGMGIRCIELADIEDLDFLMPGASVVVHGRKFLKVVVTYVVDQELKLDSREYTAYGPNDEEITDELISNNLVAIQDAFPLGKPDEVVTHLVHLRTDGFYLKRPGDDKRVPLKGVNLKVTYVYEQTESKFQARSYKEANESSGKSLAGVATASFVINGEEKELAIVGTESGTTVHLIHKK